MYCVNTTWMTHILIISNCTSHWLRNTALTGAVVSFLHVSLENVFFVLSIIMYVGLLSSHFCCHANKTSLRYLCLNKRSSQASSEKF